MKTTTVVMEQRDGMDVEVQTFRVEHPDGTFAVPLMRAAVADFFASTPTDAREALDYTGGYFNWADAMNTIPDELWRKHGLNFIVSDGDEWIDHDEDLAPIDFEQDKEG